MYNELKILYTARGRRFRSLYIQLVRVFVNKTLTTISNS